MARVELEEAPEGSAAQGMTGETFFPLKEGQLVGHIELVSVAVVFCTPAIVEMWEGIGDVVVRRGKGTNGGAAGKQFGVNVQQFRVSIASLELQAVAHALLRFHNEGVVVGADAVRAVVEARI